jgi:GTP cyclohydrolase II
MQNLVKLADAKLPTKYGDFNIIAFSVDKNDPSPHLVLIHEDVDVSQPVELRIHSECITGDLFGSKKCDCGEQLQYSMEHLSAHKGVLIYLRQEGRGIGIVNKLKAYKLQEQGLDTIESNVHLGFLPDERDFQIAINILKFLKINSVNLLTNNPEKLDVFLNSGIKLVERVPIIIEANETNKKYIDTKKSKMGHLY